MVVDIVRVVAGLVILIVAADRLVVSAVRIAKGLNISVVIIGAVIVGFGTSIPEFVVSAVASSQGDLDLALANVVASNTSNITLVLGIAAVLAVIETSRAVIRREGLLMVVAVTLLAVMTWRHSVTRIEGVILLIGMLAALVLLVRWSRENPDDPMGELEDIESVEGSLMRESVFGIVALVGTVVAGQQLLLGVEGIGTELGLSVVFMGLITGVGTSLPELSAAVAAARRGHSDLVLGNVLGSNVFNSLGVAGLAIVVGPGPLHELNPALLTFMVGSALFAGVFAFTSQRITRLEGAVLVALFAVYAILSL